MLKCSKCGKNNKDNYHECIRCGASLNSVRKPEQLTMTYHKILKYLKIFIALTAITSLYTSFDYAGNNYRLVNQIFYVLEFILISLSFFQHERKNGVVFLFLWGYVELGLYFAILIVAGFQNAITNAMIMQVINYTIGSITILYPTYLYYKKRYILLS